MQKREQTYLLSAHAHLPLRAGAYGVVDLNCFLQKGSPLGNVNSQRSTQSVEACEERADCPVLLALVPSNRTYRQPGFFNNSGFSGSYLMVFKGPGPGVQDANGFIS